MEKTKSGTRNPLSIITNNKGPLTIVGVMLSLAGLAKVEFEYFDRAAKEQRQQLFQIIVDMRNDAAITRAENRTAHDRQIDSVSKVHEGLTNVAVALARIEATMRVPIDQRPRDVPKAAVVPPIEKPPIAPESRPKIAEKPTKIAEKPTVVPGGWTK